MTGRKAGIIGAGIAGIAAAIRMANKGYHVDVFEANAYPGGKLRQVVLNGYRFDAGPSLFTLPELVEELFLLSGEQPEKHFKYKRLPIICKYFYEDGTIIDAYAERTKLIDEIHLKTQESKESIARALNRSAYLYDILSDLFMKNSLHRWRTYVSPKAFKAYQRIHRLDFFRSMHQANQQLFKDQRVVQLFDRYATYNGSDPYQTPATMNIIPHLEFNTGAFFPLEGMVSITTSLFELAKRLGVTFHFNSPVSKIFIHKKKVTGLLINNVEQAYDIVISNMDVVNTYKKLLKDQVQPKKLLNQPKSSSALIFYWGVEKLFPMLDLHNIFFSKDYQQEFEYIFKKQDVCEDPTVYINVSSKYKPDDAPKGCENWFTMINVPNNSGQDWKSIIKKCRKNIISKVSHILQEDISRLIACEAILDPVTIEQQTSSSMGALYGNSSNNKYAAFLRHANFSRNINGLYFCGGSVHPGGGIPLSLLSAKIMSDQISAAITE